MNNIYSEYEQLLANLLFLRSLSQQLGLIYVAGYERIYT